MKRRIIVAIVTVAAVAVLAFGVPLGVVIDRQYESQALLGLERAAILATRNIPAGWRPGNPLELDGPSRDTVFGVYDTSAARVFGRGPSTGDVPVRTALQDQVGEAENSEVYVITVPIISGGEVVGALRAEQRLTATDRRIRAAWASMGLLGFGVISGAALLARSFARRIAQPVEALHTNAGLLGVDGSTVQFSKSGMAEIDDVAIALEHAAARVNESVERERAFSAEISHQLRTPITGLRLLIDTELVAPRPQRSAVLHDAAAAVGRLETTIEELLALARNRPTDRELLGCDVVLADLQQRWKSTFASRRRVLRSVPVDANVAAVASKSALGHVLDVLVDNALRHGAGDVTVHCEAVTGGVAIRVSDQGQLDDAHSEQLFSGSAVGGNVEGSDRRRIGLSMARRLTQAEGGDLVCSSATPTTFSVLLVAPEKDSPKV